MKNLLCLLLFVTLIFSCGKDQFEFQPEQEVAQEIVTDNMVASDELTPTGERAAKTCNKIRVSSATMTVTYDEYVTIYNSLAAGIGFQNSSCQIVYSSSTNLTNNLVLSNFTMTTLDIELTSTSLICYVCGNGPLCPWVGSNLALVQVANNGGFYTNLGITGGFQDVIINLGAILNPSFLC